VKIEAIKIHIKATFELYQGRKYAINKAKNNIQNQRISLSVITFPTIFAESCLFAVTSLIVIA
jgi:hypothetical protein